MPSLESLLRVLPEVPDLAPLREALLGASLPDPDKQWASAGHYTTYDKRVVAPAALADALAAGRAAALEQVERSCRGAAALLDAAATDSATEVVSRLLDAGAEAESAGDLDHAAAWYDVAARLSAVLPDRSPLIQALRRGEFTRTSWFRVIETLGGAMAGVFVGVVLFRGMHAPALQ